jgi:hypothetical protein
MKLIKILLTALAVFLTACGGGDELEKTRYTLGGTMSGLNGSVVLAWGSEDLIVTTTGSFKFISTQPSGVTYSVTVKTQPTSQECTVTNGSGTTASENVTTVQVTCQNTSWFASTFAGSSTGEQGDVNIRFEDEIPSMVKFNKPTGIAIISDDRIFKNFIVNDSANNKLKSIETYNFGKNNYSMRTNKLEHITDGENRLNGFGGFFNDQSGSYVYLSIGSTTNGSWVPKLHLNLDFTSSAFASDMNMSRGIVRDSSGNVYVADTGNFVIKKITPAGAVSIFAGSLGNAGSDNGLGAAAKFNSPWGMAIDSAQNIYVADSLSSNIRKITPSGQVSTLAGPSDGSTGATDGTGAAARFTYPRGLTVDASGNVFVADTYNNMIRKINPQGVVTTLAGRTLRGYTNGWADVAQFNRPEGIAVDAAGNLFVADTSNNVIRLLQKKVVPIQ